MNFKNIPKVIQAYRAGQIDKRIIKKFFLIVGAVSGGYLIAASIVTMSLIASSGGGNVIPDTLYLPQDAPSPIVVNGDEIVPPPDAEEDEGNFLSPPSRTNILILGIDHFRLADVIIAGSFERDTGDINLLHIPRDTFTQLPQSRIDNMAANGLWVPNHGILKINAIRSLGRDYGVHFLKEQLSETLGIEFHYYIEISIEAFREVVDLIGGVELEIPRRMVYHDPYQNLFIDIPAGIHILDGRMAEYFVRYREYPDGDLGRINAQQQFMTQLFRQALRRETIMNDPVGLARVALRHTETNVGLDLFRYIPYVANLSPDRIFTYTLPGNEQRIHGASYYVPDAVRIPEVINRMFFGIVPEEEHEPETVSVMLQPSSANDARIAVLNGTRIGGLAMNMADKLFADGFQIVQVGSYFGTQENRTRIHVREEGIGTDLLKYFNNAVISVDNRMADDFDVVIIMGRSEQ